MTVHRRIERRLPYEPEDLLSIVTDVERYPEFLKWVRAARVRQHSPADDTVDADVLIGHRLFTAPVSARMTVRDRQHVRISYLKGPIRAFSCNWDFQPQEADSEAPDCRVRVTIDLDPGLILRPIVTPVIDGGIDKLVAAFEARARSLFGDCG